jgi:hypothetical protein
MRLDRSLGAGKSERLADVKRMFLQMKNQTYETGATAIRSRSHSTAKAYQPGCMKAVPIKMAKKLRSEGMAWRDVLQESAWATGDRFTAGLCLCVVPAAPRAPDQ